jgi:hypothetical protein
MDLMKELKNMVVLVASSLFLFDKCNCQLCLLLGDAGSSSHTVNVLTADGQLSNQQGNVIYTTYPGTQITQFQLG